MRKTIEDHKNELIDALVAARNGVMKAVASLPPDRVDKIFLGVWSVNDLLAHLVGWDYTNLQAVQEILAGRYPTIFQNYDKDWRSYNARLIEEYKPVGSNGSESFSIILDETADSHKRLVSFLESLSAENLVNGKARSEKGRTITIRNLLRAEANDERVHSEQIIAFFSSELKR